MDVEFDHPLADVVRPGLKVLFCGLNPSLNAAASGAHFSSPSNRFWRVLLGAGFVPDMLNPREGRRLLDHGYGITSVVGRPTRSAADVARQEYAQAARGFHDKIRGLHPRIVAFLGKPAYAEISRTRHLAWGRQASVFAEAHVWVLPNPSGLNRAFSLQELVEAYKELKTEID